VKLLLDTHCWLWLLANPDRLRTDVIALLCDPENDVYLFASAALSRWSHPAQPKIGEGSSSFSPIPTSF
jgi:PIN domain nuclease of toxin-antitoxin system